MRRRLLAALLGAALVGLALSIVGLDDRVTDAAGATWRGRIVESGETIVLRTTGGDRTFDPAAVRVRAGLLSAFRTLAARPGAAALGLLAHLLSIVAVHLRWGVLLRAAGFAMPVVSILRLGWVGQFAASVLPGGLATGDVVKALYAAARMDDRRARAVTTVVFDRLLGLVVLSTIALSGALLAPGSTRLGAARPILAALLLAGLLLLALLLSPRLRASSAVSRLAPRRLEAFAQEAMEALALYAGKGRAVALAALVALLSQSLVLLALYLYGRALGVAMSPFAMFAALPVAQMLSAVPGLPGGFGVGDLAFVALLPGAGVPAGTALALSFTYKALHVLIALPAGFLARR